MWRYEADQFGEQLVSDDVRSTSLHLTIYQLVAPLLRTDCFLDISSIDYIDRLPCQNL